VPEQVAVLIAVMAVWLIVPAAGWAGAEPGAAPRTLTLEQALSIAVQHNREIQQAQENRHYVRGQYIEARASALPQVTLSGGMGQSNDLMTHRLTGAPPDSEVTSAQAELTQPLFTWGQVSAALRAAKVGLAIADDQVDSAQQGVIRQVTAAFYDVLLAREFAALAAQNLEQKVRHLDEAERKHAAGLVTDYDVLAARVAVQNARPEVIRSQNVISAALQHFRFLLGAGDDNIDVAGSWDCPAEPLPPYEVVLAAALAQRPELRALRNQMAFSQQLVKIAKAGDKPRIGLNATYGWGQVETGPLSADGEAWSAGIYLSFPVFNGLRTQGQVRQAESAVASLKIGEQQLIDGLTLAARIAVDAVQEAREIVAALAGTVQQAERLLQMAEKGYELGVMTRLDVDDAELNLLNARSNLARAQRDCLVSAVELKWVMGELRFE